MEHSKIYTNSIAVTYEDLATVQGCERCSCCTFCQDACGCAGEETEDETILRVLGLPVTDDIKNADRMRNEFVVEEEEFFKNDGDEDSGGTDEDSDDLEEDGDED